jgi:hypothetical protein
MKTYSDLTDDEFKELHRAVLPFTRNNIVKVDRQYVKGLDPNIETRVPHNDYVITWWISDGSMEINTEISFNPFQLVKKCKEFGLTY